MNKHNVSLNSLRMFEAAARHLSFTAAALELNVSQAAVSQQMRNLEDQLGVKLFGRTARKLSITPAGEDLATATRAAMLSINQSLDRICGSSDTTMLAVTTLPSFAARWLIPRLDSFTNAHPDIDLHVHTSDGAIDLLGGRIDAALRLAARERPGLITEQLMPEGFCLVATPELAKKVSANPKLIYDHIVSLDDSQMADEHPKDMTDRATEASLLELDFDMDRLKTRNFSSSENVVVSALGGNSLALTRLSLCVDDLEQQRLAIVLDYCKPLDEVTSLVYPDLRKDEPNLLKLRQWLAVECADFTDKMNKYLRASDSQ